MSSAFEATGSNAAAPFTLKLHRGDGMTLIAMNWRAGPPPKDFVGFAIEYREPGGDRFYALKNRIAFATPSGAVDPRALSTRLSPIQKFRWVHFPRNAELAGDFTYRVTPVFMNESDELSYGEAQTASIQLMRETHRGKLNVTFTRGFVSSQAFVDRYASAGDIATLLPGSARDGLDFVPSHPKAKDALAWMGFEARHAILEVLDAAIADAAAEVRVVAYDLSEPDVVGRLEKLGARLKIIIDDDGAHGERGSPENRAAKRLAASAGKKNVKRQHLGKLQHNKTIAVRGPKAKIAVCGSTNFTWRGFFVQSNNAVVLRGAKAVAPFFAAFDDYWKSEVPKDFGKTASAGWQSLGLAGIDAKIAFSPHAAANAVLSSVAEDVEKRTTSSLFYSLAFLYQTPGLMQDAIRAVSSQPSRFVYGISDRKVGGLDLQMPDGNVAPVFPAALAGPGVPEPFKSEPVGGGGNRLHHKFLVVDFDKPTARVYFGSYNFSIPADGKNGENLVIVRDRRIAVSYMIEALRIFDHYHFRVAQAAAETARSRLELKRPPRKAGELPWWKPYYADARRIRDRELFA
jgi:phosphatidylserine/phosphatidylglycerophosphate/cardiolipin synthase-like enzyme